MHSARAERQAEPGLHEQYTRAGPRPGPSTTVQVLAAISSDGWSKTKAAVDSDEEQGGRISSDCLVTGSSSAVHARQGSLWERTGCVGADLATGHSKKRYQRVVENPVGQVERFETCFEW